MVGRWLALALGAALGLVALLVAWLADGRGARDAPPAAAARVPRAAGAGADELLAAPAVSDELERTPIAAVPRDAGVALAQPSGAPGELGPGEALLRVYVVALETREPVAGASVRLESPDGVGFAAAASGRASGTRDEGLVTDGEGRAHFRVPAREPLVLHARFELEPGRSSRLPVRPIEPGQYRTAIVGVFVEPDRTWCARVVDGATGLPIAGATFTPAGSDFASAVFQAWSGADGRLSVALGEAIGSLSVAREGYGSVVVEPTRAGSIAEEQVIELLRSAALEVLVRDVEGDPVLGAEVAVWPIREEARGGTTFGDAWRERTDAEGRAVLAALRAGTRLVAAVKTDRLARIEELVLGPGERRAVVWGLAEGGTVSGTVREATGAPVVGADLRFVPADPGSRRMPAGVPDELALRATTDADGRFLFRGVPTGAWRAGAPPRELVLSTRFAGDDGVVYGGIPGGGPDAGDPLAAVAIEARDVFLVAGEARALDLRAWRGLTIRGKLPGGDIGSFLEPRIEGVLAAAGIVVHAESPGCSADALSDASGDFELGPLLPGEYVLTARFPDGKTGHARAIAGATGVEIRPFW